MKQLFVKIFSLSGFLFCISIVLQTGIVLYNIRSGEFVVTSTSSTIIYISERVIVGFLSSLLVAFPLVYLIQILNNHFPWGKLSYKRVLIEGGGIILVSFLISLLVSLLINVLNPAQSPAEHSIIRGTLIYSITNLLFVASIEGLLFYKESRRLKLEEAKLRNEIAGIKLEILKSQINQHFMFNSLNVLSSLLRKDPEKAQRFIQEFSNIYRYVIDSIEQPLTQLENELEFVKSYVFLQKIRYGQSLTFSEEISEEALSGMLPPLSLQVILENAIKHNIVNEERPLHIEIYNDGDSLVIKNNFQPKISNIHSTGLGQKNVKRRYQIICEKSPEFILEDGYYIALLPLIGQIKN